MSQVLVEKFHGVAEVEQSKFPKQSPVSNNTKFPRGALRKKMSISRDAHFRESKISLSVAGTTLDWKVSSENFLVRFRPSVVYRSNERAFNLFHPRRIHPRAIHIYVCRKSVFEKLTANRRSRSCEEKHLRPPSILNRTHCTHRLRSSIRTNWRSMFLFACYVALWQSSIRNRWTVFFADSSNRI